MNSALLVIYVFTFIAALITGCALFSFAYSVPGIHARIRGILKVYLLFLFLSLSPPSFIRSPLLLSLLKPASTLIHDIFVQYKVYKYKIDIIFNLLIIKNR